MGFVATISSQYLNIASAGGVLTLSVEDSLERHIGLRHHKQRVGRLLAKHLKSFSEVPKNCHALSIPVPKDETLVRQLLLKLRAIDRLLDDIACEPLGPKVVERALGITTQERLRWSKDGRLPLRGTGQLRYNKVVSFPTYAPEKLDVLISNPAAIAVWRQLDAGHEAATDDD